MKKLSFGIILLLWTLGGMAQTAEEVLKNAREFSMQGDAENAILVLKKGVEKFPNDTELRQDLAMAYYAAQRNPQALETLRPMLDGERPPETVYEIAALIYRSERQMKEAEKLYKAGLKQYPSSGGLHNEYGQFLDSENPGKGEGIKMWEKGIEVAPAFAANYYQATRYYGAMNNTLWTILYGEIFVNLDSYSSRTVEIKNILMLFYKRAFAYGFAGLNSKNDFEKAVSEAMLAQRSVATSGITPESLSAIRARFVLDWYTRPEAEKYPFRLFERQRQMLREGFFDAYNQWLFGGAFNITTFQNWTNNHPDDYQAFTRFQRSKLFVINTSQYYK